jgi:hypothetical protein
LVNDSSIAGYQHERIEEEWVTIACHIITTAANALMVPIHDRMPVIFDCEQWGVQAEAGAVIYYKITHDFFSC